jgi:hypothetical protein
MPIFAKMAVSEAKKAESKAAVSQDIGKSKCKYQSLALTPLVSGVVAKVTKIKIRLVHFYTLRCHFPFLFFHFTLPNGNNRHTFLGLEWDSGAQGGVERKV